MTEIRFYHLTTKKLEQALPEILTKALSTERRVVVKAPDDKAVETLNKDLWTWRAESFLPHGSKKDGAKSAPDQPIWITSTDENPNEGKILILTNGTQSEKVEDFDLCCEMFDGNHPESLAAAREHWKSYKDTDHDLTYWQQTPTGGWGKKG